MQQLSSSNTRPFQRRNILPAVRLKHPRNMVGRIQVIDGPGGGGRGNSWLPHPTTNTEWSIWLPHFPPITPEWYLCWCGMVRQSESVNISNQGRNTPRSAGTCFKDDGPDQTQKKKPLDKSRRVQAGLSVHDARFSANIYTRGCHWFPRLLA
jgi:hypothetical protein